MRLSGEPMPYKSIKKMNSRLNFLARKKQFFCTRPQTAFMQRIDSVAF